MSQTYEMDMRLITNGGHKEIYIPDKELYQSYDTFARISMITNEIRTPDEQAALLASSRTTKRGERMINIDYGQIIELCAIIIRISIPIGLILSLTEFAVAFFVKNVLGRWKNGV